MQLKDHDREGGGGVDEGKDEAVVEVELAPGHVPTKSEVF